MADSHPNAWTAEFLRDWAQEHRLEAGKTNVDVEAGKTTVDEEGKAEVKARGCRRAAGAAAIVLVAIALTGSHGPKPTTCWAIAHVLGGKPVQVPCSTAPDSGVH